MNTPLLWFVTKEGQIGAIDDFSNRESSRLFPLSDKNCQPTALTVSSTGALYFIDGKTKTMRKAVVESGKLSERRLFGDQGADPHASWFIMDTSDYFWLVADGEWREGMDAEGMLCTMPSEVLSDKAPKMAVFESMSDRIWMAGSGREFYSLTPQPALHEDKVKFDFPGTAPTFEKDHFSTTSFRVLTDNKKPLMQRKVLLWSGSGTPVAGGGLGPERHPFHGYVTNDDGDSTIHEMLAYGNPTPGTVLTLYGMTRGFSHPVLALSLTVPPATAALVLEDVSAAFFGNAIHITGKVAGRNLSAQQPPETGLLQVRAGGTLSSPAVRWGSWDTGGWPFTLIPDTDLLAKLKQSPALFVRAQSTETKVLFKLSSIVAASWLDEEENPLVDSSSDGINVSKTQPNTLRFRFNISHVAIDKLTFILTLPQGMSSRGKVTFPTTVGGLVPISTWTGKSPNVKLATAEKLDTLPSKPCTVELSVDAAQIPPTPVDVILTISSESDFVTRDNKAIEKKLPVSGA